jgi:uncharacterized protein with PQ loop repeat
MELYEVCGYIGGFFLTINAIPEVIRTIKDARCHIGWAMLLLWFLGECFMLVYAFELMSIPLIMNYVFNFFVVVILSTYKIRTIYRIKMKHTTEHPIVVMH